MDDRPTAETTPFIGVIGHASLARRVFALAWPVMIAMGLGTLYSLVDAYWIGRLGPTALAALSPAHFAAWILWALGAAIEMGIPALVARAVGAGDLDRARRAVAGGLQLALVMGVIVAVVSRAVCRATFDFVGAAPEVSALGEAYLSVLLWGSAAIFVFMAFESVLRAAGDTRTPMFLSVVMLSVNAALDPFLILGWGPFPRWGVTGAAIATVIAHLVGVSAYVLYIARGRTPLRPTWHQIRRPAPAIWGRLLRVGTPGSFNAGLFTLVYLFLSNVVATLGNAPLAVLGVGNRLESINYLIANGFSIAASTMVGQSLGAGDTRLAERAAWMAALQSAIFTGTVGLAFLVFAEPVFGLFSDDVAIVTEGARFLRILALCQLWMGVEIAVFGAFTGAGNTLPPGIISSALSLIRIPLGYLLAFRLELGPVSIWWMLTITSALRGILLAVWFRRGRWKRAGAW